MKKLLGILAISALAASAFAQGTVVFINNTAGLARQWTSAADSTLISVPVGAGHVELLTAAAGSSLAPLGTLSAAGFATPYTTLAGFLAANAGWSGIAATGFTPVAGRFNGGTFTLPGIAAGANASYAIIGWTGTAATFDAAMQIPGTFFGESALLTTGTGNPGTTPAGTAIPLSTTFTGLTMAPLVTVPEPTSFALAGLGLAALVAFRRRS
jgi:PEP-CTERM motif